MSLHKLLITFLTITILSFGSQGQNISQKKQRKSSSAFINIAHQDAKSQGINSNISKQFGNSIQTFGDRKLVEDLIIRVLLFGPSHRKAAIIFDSVYIRIADDCPRINNFIYINPYLVSYYSIFSYLRNNKGSNPESTYQEYLKWQKLNLPNAPVGINESKGEGDDISIINNTQNWVINYPDEFKLAVSIYQKDYDDYIKGKKRKISDEEFFRNALSSSGRFSKEELDELVYYRIELESAEQNAIPDNEFMRKDTEQFINDAYETLFMRNPDKDEIDFCSSFIKNHPELTAKMFYYAMMTSNEYKWY